MAGDWLSEAVVYEIYPQSYADSDGDGIGDLRGVIGRLDHIESLSVDTIWFNPCFASPFVAAGSGCCWTSSRDIPGTPAWVPSPGSAWTWRSRW